jgi:demethylmenaquinone methyltransferase/2-methoxy-6-polyprenyl-1,4-benzoquinol methylase
VIKPGGRVVCLEFTQPEGRIFRSLYDFYSFTLLPAMGTILSGDRTGIYQYLPDSIRKFPPAESLRQLMLGNGFSKVSYTLLSGGIVAVHVGIKQAR